MKTQIKTVTNAHADREEFRLEIYFRGQNFAVEKSSLPFSVGRESKCDLIVEDNLVSRVHCVFELRENQIGLLDKSTNGTFIMSGRSESVRVKDGFYPLIGHGYIKLGDQIDLDDPELMLFKIVKVVI